MIDIDKLIKEKAGILVHFKEDNPAYVDKLKKELAVYRLIKAKEIELKTAKNAKPFDDAVQINMLRKMIKEREDSAKIYTENNRNELASKEYAEAIIIKELLPPEISPEDIEKYVVENFNKILKKEMGFRIKCVKDTFPTADGKTISEIIKKHIVNG